MSRPATTPRPRPTAAPMARTPARTSSGCTSRPQAGHHRPGRDARGRVHHRPPRHAGAHHHQRRPTTSATRASSSPATTRRSRASRSAPTPQQQQDHRGHRGRLLVPRQLPQRRRGAIYFGDFGVRLRRRPASPRITSTATGSRRTTASPSPMARATGIPLTWPTGRSANNEFVGAPIDLAHQLPRAGRPAVVRLPGRRRDHLRQ